MSAASSTSSARALAHDEAVALGVHRPRGVRRVVVVAVPSARMMSNAPNASGDSGHSTPPAIAASISPFRIAPIASPIATAPEAHELAVERIGPRTSSAMPEVGRRGAAEHREREGRGDRSQAAVEVLLVLRFGERDAAQRGPEVDPDPVGLGRAADAGHEAGVGHRHAPGREAELREPVEGRATARASMWSAGSKSSTCAATWDRNGDGSKRSMRLTGDAFARRPARNAGSPIPIAEITPTPGDPDVARGRPCQDRSPAAVAGVAEGLGEGLASSPASGPRSGRVNARSTNAANAGDARAEVVLDLDPRAAVPGRLDRPGHVHALASRRRRGGSGAAASRARSTSGCARPRGSRAPATGRRPAARRSRTRARRRPRAGRPRDRA